MHLPNVSAPRKGVRTYAQGVSHAEAEEAHLSEGTWVWLPAQLSSAEDDTAFFNITEGFTVLAEREPAAVKLP